MSRFPKFVIFLVIVALTTVGCLPTADPQATVVPTSAPAVTVVVVTATPAAPTNTPEAPKPTEVPAQNDPAPTAQPASAQPNGGFVINPNTLGEAPQAGEVVDPKIYGKPFSWGTMTNDQGKGFWTQSSKTRWAELHGMIPEGTYIELDAYTVVQNGKTYDKGNLFVLAGPLDLDQAKVKYLDGGANWVQGDIQAFLLDNVYGKWCRGDLIVDDDKQPILVNGEFQFKYVPWALKNIMLPEGVTFPSLASCPRSRADDHTTYPTP